MSKRVQESNLKELSAVAKPKLMILNLSSTRKVLSQEARGLNSREIKVWTSMVSQPAAGNSLRGPPTMARQCILKRGNKAMLKPQTPGNREDRRIFSSARSWKQSAKERGPSLGRRES